MMRQRVIALILLLLAQAMYAGTNGKNDQNDLPRISREEVQGAVWNKCPDPLRISYERGPVILASNGLKQLSDNTFFVNRGEKLSMAVLTEYERIIDVIDVGGPEGNGYQIEFKPGRRIVLTELLEDEETKTLYPFITQIINCGESGCPLSSERYVLDLPSEKRGLDRDMVEKMITIIQNTPETVEPVSSFSNSLLLCSLAGNYEALQMLRKPPFTLEGDQAEVWSTALRTYARAAQLKENTRVAASRSLKRAGAAVE